jgi:hypothetical protein
MEKRINERQEAKDKQQAKVLEAKLQSDNYVDFLIEKRNAESNYDRLRSLADMSKEFKAVKRPTGTVEVRFGKSYLFNDEVLNYILGIVQMVQYAPSEYRRELEAVTGLNELTIAEFSKAMGNMPYFSKVSKTVVPGVKPDIEGLQYMLQDIATKMKLKPLDLSQVTEEYLATKFNIAQKDAESKLADHLELTATITGENVYSL